jgi:cytochrome b
MADTDATMREQPVWDLPTRLFHWALVASVSAGWLIGENMSFANIQWHFYLGYATGGLLVFRLIWGVIGPPSARLSALVPSPAALAAYLRDLPKREPTGAAGHAPLGALASLALLTTLSVQVVSGLLSESDDFFTEGPLAAYASSAVIRSAGAVHHTASEVLLYLVGLHVAAIAFYALWKRENLVRAMITGRKPVRR